MFMRILATVCVVPLAMAPVALATGTSSSVHEHIVRMSEAGMSENIRGVGTDGIGNAAAAYDARASRLASYLRSGVEAGIIVNDATALLRANIFATKSLGDTAITLNDGVFSLEIQRTEQPPYSVVLGRSLLTWSSIFGPALTGSQPDPGQGYTDDGDCTVTAQDCTLDADCTTGTCTSGQCTSVGNCTTSNYCTSGGQCTGGEDCTQGTGCTSGTGCTDSSQCTAHDWYCTNGDFCTGSGNSGCTKGEGCTNGSGCTIGAECTSGPSCTDGNSCTGVDGENGCTAGPNCTYDGSDCTGSEVCTGEGACTIGDDCTGGTRCTDGGSCTGGDDCSSGTGCTDTAKGCTSTATGNGCTDSENCNEIGMLQRDTVYASSGRALLLMALFGGLLGVAGLARAH